MTESGVRHLATVVSLSESLRASESRRGRTPPAGKRSGMIPPWASTARGRTTHSAISANRNRPLIALAPAGGVDIHRRAAALGRDVTPLLPGAAVRAVGALCDAPRTTRPGDSARTAHRAESSS